MMNERIQYVIVYAPSQEGNLPLVVKDKPDFLKGVLNLPGGKVESRETVTAAAVRELREETGLVPIPGTVEVLGVVIGSKSDIHVVKVGVVEGPLTPSPGETEVFNWYDSEEVLTDPRLMPNLRLVLPLCYAGAAGWNIYDIDGDWRGVWHQVGLQLHNGIAMPLQTRLPGMEFYKDKPCTTPVTL